MLNLRSILKIGRMIEDCGGYELPEDYFSQDIISSSSFSENRREINSVRVSLNYELDVETGDVHITQY